VLIDRIVNACPWRDISPAAKSLFALSGFIAIFAAGQPSTAAIVSALLILVTLFGAGIKLGAYLRVAAPALLFLMLGCLSLAYTLEFNASSAIPHIALAADAEQRILILCSRSTGALAAMLFLVLSTPINDLLGLLRRLRAPALLLDIMQLCHRMLYVISAAVQATHTAQAARLGYATPATAMRSLGELVASLSLQVWQRAHYLHLAAQARNNDGPLRFIERQHANARRDCLLAGLAGCLLIAAARWLP